MSRRLKATIGFGPPVCVDPLLCIDLIDTLFSVHLYF
jgi:hypothetical protein